MLSQLKAFFSTSAFSLLGLALGVLLLAHPAASFAASEAELFAEGVELFKAGKHAEAKLKFIELESSAPGNPATLLNLGLIAAKEKRPGAAIALWRKGLSKHPANDELTNAVEWTRKKLPKGEIAHEFDTWESMHDMVFSRVSPMATVIVAALFLLIGGWLLLRWFGKRRRALDEDLPMPTAPLGGIVICILFVALFVISIGIFLDRLDIRGTVIAENAKVRSIPEKGATALFELYEGMEVVIRDTRTVGNETWRRISYPGGLSGWILESEVFAVVDASERAFPNASSATPKSEVNP